MNAIMREKILELANYLFNFIILKLNAMAIFQNMNCQALIEAIFIAI